MASTLLVATAIVLALIFFTIFRDNWRLAISVVLAAAAFALLTGNLRDLRHGWIRPHPPADETPPTGYRGTETDPP